MALPPESWLDDVLQWLNQWLSQWQWPGRDDIQNWAQTHPDAVLLAGVLVGLLCLVLGVAWWVSHRHHRSSAAQSVAQPQVFVPPDFEMQLGISRADLAEVGLPLLTPERAPDLSGLPPRMTSLEALSMEHLFVVARYCVWKGDAEGARVAVALITARGDALQRDAARALLEA